MAVTQHLGLVHRLVSSGQQHFRRILSRAHGKADGSPQATQLPLNHKGLLKNGQTFFGDHFHSQLAMRIQI